MDSEQSKLRPVTPTSDSQDDSPPNWSGGFSWSYGSLLSSFDSAVSYDTDQGEEQRWRLQLPVHGAIALRRALKRGDDPFDIERQQRSQLHHECESKYGPLRDVDVVFKDVDWVAAVQPHSEAANVVDGEDLSPGSVLRADEMSIREHLARFGIDETNWRDHFVVDGEDKGKEQPDGADQAEEEEGPFDGLLEHYYYARRRSDVQAEAWLEENPFAGRPASA